MASSDSHPKLTFLPTLTHGTHEWPGAHFQTWDKDELQSLIESSDLRASRESCPAERRATSARDASWARLELARRERPEQTLTPEELQQAAEIGDRTKDARALAEPRHEEPTVDIDEPEIEM